METLRDTFLPTSADRFPAAIARLDPLHGELLLRWLDPISGSDAGQSAKIHWGRLLTLVTFSSAPSLVLSLIPDRTLGGAFWGANGMRLDGAYLLESWVVSPLFLTLLLFGRRLLGDLINQLEQRLGASFDVRGPLPLDANTPRLLRFIEWLSRVDPVRSTLWAAFLLLFNASAYYSFLTDGFANWLTSPATPGTFFYFAHVGGEQPNVAGLWANLVCGPINGYVGVLLARVTVAFAVLCNMISKNVEEHIVPTHPDGAGGLQPVGKVSLVLSIPILVVGLFIAALTLQDKFIWKVPVKSMVVLDFALYLLLAPLLFLLPLLPLQKVMYRAKKASLERLHDLYRQIDMIGKNRIHSGNLAGADFGQQFAVLKLIELTEAMSVWPLDRRTLIRFGGMVVSPIVAVVTSEIPNFLKSFAR